MNTVIISKNYQVIIPEDIRERTDIKPGTKVEVPGYGNRIELVPIQPIKKLKGIFKGIDTRIERELS